MVSIVNNTSAVTLPSTSPAPMSYEDNASILSYVGKPKRWKDLRPLEKILVVIIGIVSLVSIALIIAVAVIGSKLTKVEEKAWRHSQGQDSSTTLPFAATTPLHNGGGGGGSATSPTTTKRSSSTSSGRGPSSDTTTTTTTATTQGAHSHEHSGGGMNPIYKKYCLDADCTLAAGEVLRSMDLSIDPCKNFYKFACGNWEERNPIPESVSSWDQVDLVRGRITRQLHYILQEDPDNDLDPEPIQMAQKFYKDCVKQDNTNNYSVLKEFVDHLLSEYHRDLATSLGHIRRVLGGQFIFSLTVDMDEKNASRNAIYLDQPLFGIPRPQLVAKNYHHGYLVEAYGTLVEDVWRKVFEDNREVEAAANVIYFERLLAENTAEPEERLNKSETYNAHTVAELYELTDAEGFIFSWENYLNEAFFDIYDPIKNRTSWNKTNVIVRDVHYFHMLETTLKGNKSQIIEDFLKWRIVFAVASDVSTELRDLLFEFDQSLMGLVTHEPLWKTCVEETEKYFGMALSYHFLEEVDADDDFKKEVVGFLEDIKKTLRKALTSDRDLDWMSKETKQKAVIKLDKMQSFVGYPEWLLNRRNHTNKTLLTTELMDYYYHLQLDKDNDHFDNIEELIEWRSREGLKEINEIRDRNSDSKWLVDPIDVTAFYWAGHNSLTIPLGMLQAPFYGSPVQYLNYGALGALISHMLVHSFDQKGQQNGPDGSLVNWWDTETEKNYAKKAECYTKDYKNFTVDGKVTPIQWKQTRVQESIADNVGLKLAFKTYQSYVKRLGAEEQSLPGFNETANQLFFLSYAQMWCSGYRNEYMNSRHSYFVPTQFRSKSGLHSSTEFAKAWSCPTPPSNTTCDIW